MPETDTLTPAPQPDSDRIDELLSNIAAWVKGLLLLAHALLARDFNENEVRFMLALLLETFPYRTVACWIPEDKVLPHLSGIRSGSNLNDVVASLNLKGAIRVHLQPEHLPRRIDRGRLFQLVTPASKWNVGPRPRTQDRQTARGRILRGTKQFVMDLYRKELDEVLGQLNWAALLDEAGASATEKHSGMLAVLPDSTRSGGADRVSATEKQCEVLAQPDGAGNQEAAEPQVLSDSTPPDRSDRSETDRSISKEFSKEEKDRLRQELYEFLEPAESRNPKAVTQWDEDIEARPFELATQMANLKTDIEKGKPIRKSRAAALRTYLNNGLRQVGEKAGTWKPNSSQPHSTHPLPRGMTLAEYEARRAGRPPNRNTGTHNEGRGHEYKANC